VSEPVFYQDRSTYVSRSRVVLNGTTYPVNAISAVTSRCLPKSPTPLGLGICCGILGVGMCFVSVAVAVLVFLIGAVFIAAYVSSKDSFVLILGTAGMQHQALVTSDGVYVALLLQAI